MSKQETPTQDQTQTEAANTPSPETTAEANAEVAPQAETTSDTVTATTADNTPAAEASDTTAEDVIPEEEEAEAAPAQQGTGSTDGSLVGELQEQIAKLARDVQINVEGWQRARAEFANYKRRTERELKEARERATLDALTEVLPIVDDFERAVANIPEELQGNPWASGTASILKSFEKLLSSHNITAIDPVGERFDPNLHQAVGMDDSDEYDSEHVIETLRKGYTSGGRLLRPALVRVAN